MSGRLSRDSRGSVFLPDCGTGDGSGSDSLLWGEHGASLNAIIRHLNRPCRRQEDPGQERASMRETNESAHAPVSGSRCRVLSDAH